MLAGITSLRLRSSKSKAQTRKPEYQTCRLAMAIFTESLDRIWTDDTGKALVSTHQHSKLVPLRRLDMATSTDSLDRIWHIRHRQGQILALALRSRSLKRCKLFYLHRLDEEAFTDSLDHALASMVQMHALAGSTPESCSRSPAQCLPHSEQKHVAGWHFPLTVRQTRRHVAGWHVAGGNARMVAGKSWASAGPTFQVVASW